MGAGDIVAVELTHIPSAATVVTVRRINNWLNNLLRPAERNDDGHRPPLPMPFSVEHASSVEYYTRQQCIPNDDVYV